MPSRRAFLGLAGTAGTAALLTRTRYVSVDPDGPSVSVVLPREVPAVDEVVETGGRPGGADPADSPPGEATDRQSTSDSRERPTYDDGWDFEATRRAVHDLVNGHREDEGLDALAWNDDLHAVARDYAIRMAEEGFFSHTDPSGNDFQSRYRAAGVSCRVWTDEGYLTGGENLAQTWWRRRVDTGDGVVVHDTPEGLAEGIVTGWMNSPGHRENLLRPPWNTEAIGIARADDDRVLAVQNFC